MSLGTNSKCINQGDGGQWSLGTMIIKCKTRKRERGGGGGGSLTSRNTDYKVQNQGERGGVTCLKEQ